MNKKQSYMNKYFKTLIKSVSVAVTVLVLACCESETWKDHYSYRSDSSEPVSSLSQTIEKMDDPAAQYFVETLKNTFMYNGKKQLTMTYWDMLNEDQFFTVWLPMNVSQADWDVYRSDDPNKDHKRIGTEFILNHIARFSHPVGVTTREKVKMLSDKSFRSVNENIVGINYLATNIRCTNGLVHKIEGPIPYSPNLYDYLTGAVSYKSANGVYYDYKSKFGEWFSKFTIETLDEERSVKGEINEQGEVEYIDKVIIKSSELMKKFGYINVEDSDYVVVLPTPDLWDQVFDSIKYYFTYRDSLGQTVRDSLQKHWTNSAILTDAFFNINIQKNPNDSVTSTLFKRNERLTEKYPYHVYFKPYANGGLFADRVDSVICSNGIIYVRNTWPYTDSIFRRSIRIEAEDYKYSEGSYTKRSAGTVVYYTPDSVKVTTRVIQLSKRDDTFNADFDISDNLRGKYLLKLIMFPNVTQRRCSYIYPMVINYGDTKVDTLYENIVWNPQKLEDELQKITIGNGINTGAPVKPDTIVCGPFVIPQCDYKSNKTSVRVRIGSMVDSYLNKANPGKYDKELWIDCIILEPVFD